MLVRVVASTVTQRGGFLGRLGAIGVAPDDGEQERLAKAVITLSACLVTALSTVWVITYFTLGLPVSAAIPLVYQVVSIGSLVAFARTKRLRPFRTSQLAMMLMLPFLLQLSLGGFVPSSAVVLWSFTAPVGALMFKGTRSSIGWLLAYVAVLALSGLLDPFLRSVRSPSDLDHHVVRSQPRRRLDDRVPAPAVLRARAGA